MASYVLRTTHLWESMILVTKRKRVTGTVLRNVLCIVAQDMGNRHCMCLHKLCIFENRTLKVISASSVHYIPLKFISLSTVECIVRMVCTFLCLTYLYLQYISTSYMASDVILSWMSVMFSLFTIYTLDSSFIRDCVPPVYTLNVSLIITSQIWSIQSYSCSNSITSICRLKC